MTDIEAVWRALVDRATAQGGDVVIHSKDGSQVCVHASIGQGASLQRCSNVAPSLQQALLKALMSSSSVRHD